MKEKITIEKDKESIQQALSNVTEKQLKEIEEEKLGMKSKIADVEKLLEESNTEKLKMAEELEKLQNDKKKLTEEKEEIRNEVKDILEEKNELSEKAKDLDTKLLIQADKLSKYED